MRHKEDLQKSREGNSLLPWLIFLSFGAGLVLAYKTQKESILQPGFWALSLGIGLLVLSSASVFGPVIFPAASLIIGALSYKAGEDFIEAYMKGNEIDFRFLIFAMIAIPAFFTISVRGTQSSVLILKALCSQSMAAKEKYSRSYIPVFTGSLILLFTAFILAEIKA